MIFNHERMAMFCIMSYLSQINNRSIVPKEAYFTYDTMIFTYISTHHWIDKRDKQIEKKYSLSG